MAPSCCPDCLAASTAQPQHQVQRRLLLDIVLSQRTAVLQLLVEEDQPIWSGGMPFSILDLGLDAVAGVAAVATIPAIEPPLN